MSKSKVRHTQAHPAAPPSVATAITQAHGEGVFIIPRSALSIDEVAQRVGVTRVVIRKEIRCGRLAAFRVGDRRIRISMDALTKYLKERAAAGVYPIPGGNKRKQVETEAP